MDSSAKIDISVIIPAKDESKRLPRFLETVATYCLKSPLVYEIIIVDDGSRDGTSQSIKNYHERLDHFRVITLEKNRGKGYAVKQGFQQARGDIVLFLDADGSTKPDEIENNLHYLKEGYDIVIGSRVLKSPRHKIEAKRYRKFMGAIFNFLTHTFLLKGIRDSQCGFKLFRKNIVKPLFSELRIDGFGFDLEVLFLANKMNLKIKEVPISWIHVKGSKINLFTDSLRMLINIFQIRRWHQYSIHR